MNKQEKPILQYIDPLTDFGFQRVFSGEPNKELLIDLLNSILQGRKHIVDVVYNESAYPAETVHERDATVNLTCTGDDGRTFTIEVQCGNSAKFMFRTIFYLSRIIAEQAKERSDALNEVYLIALLEDFSADVGGSADQSFYSDPVRKDQSKQHFVHAGFEPILIELDKFTKTEAELATDLDQWLYALKNMSKMDKISVNLRKPIFKKLLNRAKYTTLSEKEKAKYDSCLEPKWDNPAVLKKAVDDARAKREQLLNEMKKTIEETKEALEAKEQALKETRKAVEARKVAMKAIDEAAKAKAEADDRTVNIVRSLKAEGMSNGQIAKVTQLSIEKVEQA